MSKVTERTAALAAPIVAAQGCTLWDVEYVKEGGMWFLRVYIDKEGGVSISDCEAVSRALSDALDQADPIEGSYTFEVSSPGADRALKKPEHFLRYIGSAVDVKCYRARGGKKDFSGVLSAYEDGRVTLLSGEETLVFEKQEVAHVRLHLDF